MSRGYAARSRFPHARLRVEPERDLHGEEREEGEGDGPGGVDRGMPAGDGPHRAILDAPAKHDLGHAPVETSRQGRRPGTPLRLSRTPLRLVEGDQFVYYDAANPKRCLAPDGFVKLGVPQEDFTSWRMWEKGAPDLAVEVLSPSDTAEPITLDEKLERYGSVGVRELVIFDVDAPDGARLRAWDRIDDVLVEREVVDERTPCLTLGGLFLLAPAEERAAALRLSRDAEGLDLVPLASELKDAERAEKEMALAEKETALAELARLRAELAGRAR
jgi:hypothetical protein